MILILMFPVGWIGSRTAKMGWLLQDRAEIETKHHLSLVKTLCTHEMNHLEIGRSEVFR